MTMPDAPFWDTARAGERCVVPCWPNDEHGDGIDCPALLEGRMTVARLFEPLAVGLPAFDPGHTIWLCELHGDDGVQTFVHEPVEAER